MSTVAYRNKVLPN